MNPDNFSEGALRQDDEATGLIFVLNQCNYANRLFKDNNSASFDDYGDIYYVELDGEFETKSINKIEYLLNNINGPKCIYA